MRVAVAELESISVYSQGKHYVVPKLNEKERPDDYEKRTWRERCHYDEKGDLFIPPMAFKNCLSDAALYLSIKIPGKGTSTFTKNFLAGILVMDALPLPIKKDKVDGEWFFVPSDGKRGGGKRVNKCFPAIREWKGEVTYYVLDDTITAEVFEMHLKQAGNFIGIGRFRPRNGGYYGRFKVNKVSWREE